MAAEKADRTQAKGRACELLSCAATWVETASGAEKAQPMWAARTVGERLQVLRAARHEMAARAEEFADAMSPLLARSRADTLVTELLPLLDACKFLEREAERLLAPRKLGLSGRPMWMSGVWSEVHREPLGRVLVIGPGNFPLFLPGVQTLQALAAGNAVTWKPGVGGAAVAAVFARVMREAGLPDGALTVTDESVEAGQLALMSGPDKVVFTGSSESGRSVLARLAETATPAVAELSGADAVLVMPTADLDVVAKAVAFGLRLNGGAVCMSPRRLFGPRAMLAELKPKLLDEFAKVPVVKLDARTAGRLKGMLDEAVAGGATVHGVWQPEAQAPMLLTGVMPHMSIARSDVFAPVISVMEVESMLHALESYAACEYALTAAIFCGRSEEKKARSLAGMLKAGTVLINDVIAPTADPRVPFGGRGASGYGVTRGAEGLLEMTAVKTLLVRRSGARRHFEMTRDEDAPMFAGMIAATHGGGFARRWNGLKQMIGTARKRA
jgi:acyl-CoA reductase-like NAD-dependent aldehyde dehydrogenase